MKKQTPKKLLLSKETVHHLAERDLTPAQGGIGPINSPHQEYSKQDSVNVCCA
jgi:hypothetical protein